MERTIEKAMILMTEKMIERKKGWGPPLESFFEVGLVLAPMVLLFFCVWFGFFSEKSKEKERKEKKREWKR